LNKIILKDFQQNFNKLDELQILKKECDEIRRDFFESNQINKATIDRLKAENAELKNNYEQIRNTQITKIEESYKQKIESYRKSIKEKEKENIILSQDNTVLTSQLDILEKNLNSLKLNFKDTE
jgi:histidinol dehydrogenase